MFNDYAWQNYLKAGGNNVVEMFRKNISDKFSEEYINLILDLHKDYCPSNPISEDIKSELNEVLGIIEEGIYLFENGEYSIESGLDALFSIISGEDNLSEQSIFNYFSNGIAFYTTLLAMEIPELYVPYYFQYNFNVLEKIANEFGIRLPPIPVKKDYKGRLYYYGEICAMLFEFRNEHNMSPYELYAFLYDYAPKYIGGIDSYIIKDLPEPKSAFFIGGSKDDIFLEDTKDTITCWQCNPDTRAGDMIVMYLRTPISAVDSVWRSVSIGFNDPFFYYYRCTYIANPVGIKRITQKELQQDKVFKELPIVRKNMQGINGVELKPSAYNHLVELAGADVLKLEYVFEPDSAEFTNEKDVENKLIKPFLKKLNYTENEYEQQLRIEIGNHNATEIPDFVLLPTKSRGVQTAFAIIEAKRSIKNSKEFEAVKIQARSYAMQLSVKYAVIADKDKLWIFESSDHYVDEIMTVTWGELSNADIFSELYKLLGNKKNDRMSENEIKRRLRERQSEYFMFEDD